VKHTDAHEAEKKQKELEESRHKASGNLHLIGKSAGTVTPDMLAEARSVVIIKTCIHLNIT